MDSGFYSEAAVAAVEQQPDGTPSGMTVYAAVDETVASQDRGRFAAAARTRAAGRRTRAAKEVMAHRLKTAVGPSALPVAQADGGAGVWDYQRGDGLPAVPAARTGEGVAGMDVGLRELQPQTDVHAQKSGGGGIKRKFQGLIRPKINQPSPPVTCLIYAPLSKNDFVTATRTRNGAHANKSIS